MDSDLNDRMAMCRTSIACIRSMLRSRPNDWQSYVSHARFVMATIDTVPFSADPADLDQRTWMIEGLQKLAYHETDNGSFSDIADWCMRHWLVVLQHQPENVTTLRGLGQAWTLKAHPFLERIQREERSISSGSSQPHSGNGDYTPSDDEREAARAAAELDARLNTADYVEARGMLLPAAEYFQRAVRAAEEQRLLDGDILTTAAEAFISLSNVSYSTTNEQLFRQALEYLKQATQIPGHTLRHDLQQFLDDYGKL